MLLIIGTIIIIVTNVVFCKKIDELSMIEDCSSWGTGARYLVGDFVTESELEEMRTKVNSPKSKF